jgi:hypothetical protein
VKRVASLAVVDDASYAGAHTDLLAVHEVQEFERHAVDDTLHQWQQRKLAC